MSDEHKIARETKSFYDNYGWQPRTGGWSNEDVLFRSFPEAHKSYANNANARTAACFDGWDGSILIAGCGDMPEFHLALAKRFNRVLCMDISPLALSLARTKLGDRAEYLEQSILDTVLADNSVDTVYCAHVIYHIEQQLQERAINQLVRVTKKGGRIIVICVNSKSPFGWPRAALVPIKHVIERVRARQPQGTRDAVPKLYNYVHPMRWWRRFSPQCRVSFLASEVIGSRLARALLRAEGVASSFFSAAQWVENRFPRVALLLWQYTIVVLDKN